MNELVMKQKISTKNLVLIGMMVGITTLLDYTIGVIPLPMVSATIVHIPTIITSIIGGPVVGAVVGFFFGVESLIHAATRPPSPLSPLLINPLISVLPRILVGIMPYYVYSAVNPLLTKFKGSNAISIAIGAAAGSVTNTVGVLGMMYLVYAKRIEQFLESAPDMGVKTAKAFVLFIASTNGLAEMIITGIITVPIVLAVRKVYKR